MARIIITNLAGSLVYLFFSYLLIPALNASPIPEEIPQNEAPSNESEPVEGHLLMPAFQPPINPEEILQEVVPSNESVPAEVETDKRIGINFNRAQAHAFGPAGFGISQAESYGFQAGILNRNNQYRPLVNQFRGQSISQRFGPHAPSVWSGANSRGGPGGIGGSGHGGFRGGAGNAQAFGLSQTHRIPLGDGTVLLSNLKVPEDGEKSDTDNIVFTDLPGNPSNVTKTEEPEDTSELLLLRDKKRVDEINED